MKNHFELEDYPHEYHRVFCYGRRAGLICKDLIKIYDLREDLE
jgi:hypothetical protein